MHAYDFLPQRRVVAECSKLTFQNGGVIFTVECHGRVLSLEGEELFRAAVR
jgi:hypothetical protein